MSEFIYKPDNYPGHLAIDCKPSKELEEYHQQSRIYVKFSRNISFSESFLKKHNIEYKAEDLEDTPLGRCYVVRRDSNGK